jgi:hypothetical protein
VLLFLEQYMMMVLSLFPLLLVVLLRLFLLVV